MAPQVFSDPEFGQSQTPLKPRCGLKIGVFGNRHFDAEAERGPSGLSAHMRANAWDACAKIWQKLSDIVPEVLDEPLHLPPAYWRTVDRKSEQIQLKDFFSRETPLLTVVSSLAAGGDQIGAESAFGKNPSGVKFELEAVLPFAEDFYPGPKEKPRSEFTLDEAKKLRDLVKAARQVIRLSGRYYDDEVNRRAYRQCADVVLHHADLVLAIYDPTKKGRGAGTRETVEAALARGLAVVAVLVVDTDVRIGVYLTAPDYRGDAGAAWQSAFPIDDNRWHDRLKAKVQELLALPHQNEPIRPSREAESHSLDPFSETVERLRLMSGDGDLHPWCGGWRRRVFSLAWRTMIHRAAAWAHPLKLDPETPPHAPRDQVTLEPYAAFYNRASQLSGIYMRAYRGAFVWSFALAALAVMVAVLIIVAALAHVELEHKGVHDTWLLDGLLYVMVALGALKVSILVILIRLVHVGHRDKYQEHAADFRYLAELLRPMQWLAPLATTVPSVELPPHAGPLDPRRGWTPWLVRAIGRSTTIAAPVSPARAAKANDPASPRQITLDTDAARTALDRGRDEWLQGQLMYHWKTARQMHQIDDGLERLAIRLLWVVFGCAAAALVLEGLRLSGVELTVLHVTTVLLGTIAAILPAAIASLGGIMFQSEAKRLELRSEAMYHSLKTEQHALRALSDRLGRGIPNGAEALVAAERLRALSKELVEETGHWKVLYQTHVIHGG